MYIYGMGEIWVQLLKDQGVSTYVILVLHECIWNVTTASLVLPVFDISSLGFPPN